MIPNSTLWATPALKRTAFALLFLSSLFFVSAAFGQANFSSNVTTGNWNAAASWTRTSGSDADGVPDGNDNVTILVNQTITVSAAAAANDVTVNGTLNINQSTNNLAITNGGSVTINSSGSIVFNSTAQITGGGGNNNGIQLTVNPGANLTTANLLGFTTGGNNAELTGSFAIKIGNKPIVYSTGANYTYTGADGQVFGNALIQANNLTIRNSGKKSTSNSITVTGLLTVNSPAVFAPSATHIISRSATLGGALAGDGTIQVTRTAATADLFTQYPVYIGNTGAIEALTVDYAGLGDQTVNVLSYGNLTTSGSGTKTVAGSGSLKVSGNLTVSSPTTLDIGNFTAENTTQGTGILLVENGATLRIGGNRILPINFADYQLRPTSTVNFYGGAGSEHSILARTYGNLTLSDNTIVTATGNLNIVGNLTISSGTRFNATNGNVVTHSIQGNWTNNGTYKASGNTQFTFNGTTPQTIGGAAGTKTTFENLVVNNATGIMLAQTVEIGADGGNGSITFTNGIITSSTANPLVILENGEVFGAKNTSHVNGPVRKVGNDIFTFPVGKNGKYVPVAISAPGNATDAFTAEYFNRSAEALGPISTTAKNQGLRAVSECEFWTLDRTAGLSAVDVTLTWGPDNACTGASYIGNPFFIVVAHHTGTATPSSGQWNSFGRDGAQGDQTAGSVTWKNVNDFSPFTLGSTNAAQAPLPVTFKSLEGKRAGNGTLLTWKVADEINVHEYQVERSTTGNSGFAKIGTVSAKGLLSYNFTDEAPLGGQVYYRVKSLDNDGTFGYSNQISFKNGTSTLVFRVFPTVVSSKTDVQHGTVTGNEVITLTSADGRLVRSLRPATGSLKTTVEMSDLRAGLYILKYRAANGTTETVKLVKQ